MAAPKMTRHDMKQDDLVTAIEKVNVYVRKNTETVRNWGLAAAAVILVGAIVWWYASSRGAAADAALRDAQMRFDAPIVATGAVPDSAAPTYATEADRDQAALEAFNKVVTAYGGRTGKIGRYYQGILLARLGRTDEAQAALQAVVSSPASPTLGSLAKAQLANVLVKKGDLDGGAKMFTELSNDASGAYPKDWALYYLAGIQESQKKTSEAIASYQRIVAEFPTSPFAVEAGTKLKSAGVPIPAPVAAAPPAATASPAAAPAVPSGP